MDVCIKINSPLLHCLGNTLSFSFSLDIQFMSDTVKGRVDYTPALRVQFMHLLSLFKPCESQMLVDLLLWPLYSLRQIYCNVSCQLSA